VKLHVFFKEIFCKDYAEWPSYPVTFTLKSLANLIYHRPVYFLYIAHDINSSFTTDIMHKSRFVGICYESSIYYDTIINPNIIMRMPLFWFSLKVIVDL